MQKQINRDTGLHRYSNHAGQGDYRSGKFSLNLLNAWVKYNNWISPFILTLYHQCKVETFIVTYCSRVTSVLWYLDTRDHGTMNKLELTHPQHGEDSTVNGSRGADCQGKLPALNLNRNFLLI